MMSYEYPHPVSRTYQYKKITKPLLERKRRARINKCLDELKNLMIDALETEGEDISKLEKADILELTVRHLQRLQGSPRSAGLSATITNSDGVSAESRWLSGFGHCAAEAYRFLSALPGEGAERLASHLAAGLQKCRRTNPSKTNALAQILASLNIATDLSSPMMRNADTENVRVTARNSTNATACRGTAHDAVNLNISPRSKSARVTVRNGEELDASIVRQAKDPQEQRAAKKIKTEANVEDDEEIDVERIDDADPMWRPW